MLRQLLPEPEDAASLTWVVTSFLDKCCVGWTRADHIHGLGGTKREAVEEPLVKKRREVQPVFLIKALESGTKREETRVEWEEIFRFATNPAQLKIWEVAKRGPGTIWWIYLHEMNDAATLPRCILGGWSEFPRNTVRRGPSEEIVKKDVASFSRPTTDTHSAWEIHLLVESSFQPKFLVDLELFCSAIAIF